MAYGDKDRIDELRREIAEIQALNDLRQYSRSTPQGRSEVDRRNARLREIQGELQAMMKKAPPP